MDNNQLTVVKEKFPSVFNELGVNTEEIEKVILGLESLIKICGDDPNREGLLETPYRVLKAFLENTSGNRSNPSFHLEKQFSVEHDEEIILVKDIEFYSICEHHFVPFFGVAHVGYIPSKRITGLSKIARMVEDFSKRFQVQERLTKQIVSSMQDVLEPKGAMVVVEAKHLCMCGRGIRKSKAATVTTSSSGIFKVNQDLRNEFYDLIR